MEFLQKIKHKQIAGTAETYKISDHKWLENGEAGKKSLQTWNKSSKISNFSTFNGESEAYNKKLKKKDLSSSTKNNSTLSLNIAAYENTVASTAADFSKGGKNNKSSTKANAFKMQSFNTSILNQFEFPRQQNEKVSEPEVSRFKASQRLLNPNTVSTKSPKNYESYEREEFFKTDEFYDLITKENNRFGGTQFYFDDKTLVVNSTLTEFILVRPKNDELNEPFFEICGKYDPRSCQDTFICYSSTVPLLQSQRNENCYNNNLQTIQIIEDKLYADRKVIPLNPNEEICRKFYQMKYTDERGNVMYYLATSKHEIFQPGISEKFPQINSQSLPFNDKMIQIRMKIEQPYCGLQIRFPKALLAVDAPPPTTTPIPTTTTRRTTKYHPIKTTVKITNSNEAKESSSPLPTIGIVLGVLALVLLIIVVVAFVVRYILKRRKRKTTTIPLVPRDTQSMESIVLPPAPPQPVTAIPYMDPALEQKTQELSISVPSKTPTTTTPRTQPTQPTIKLSIDGQKVVTSRDPLKAGTKEKLSKEGGARKEGSGGNVGAGAAAAAVPEKDESDSSEIPLPALTVDRTKKCTKIMKNEFDRGSEDSMASEENCGENVYKIDGFCLQKIPLPDEAMATWPPDYVEKMAIMTPNIEHRGQFHYQAVIMANNLLLKKGIKNIRGKLSGSTKGMKWLKTRQNIPFVQFIAESIEGSPDGTGPEFLSSKIQWRRHLKKLDVVETFRQSCWLGQTKERREFFLLATFYKMEHLVKQFPREDDLKAFPFPVPMLLEVRKEAPQFFEIIEEKLPAPEKKSGSAGVVEASAPPNPPPLIPKFSNE